jgi:uncharacterized lipoprotein YmbA
MYPAIAELPRLTITALFVICACILAACSNSPAVQFYNLSAQRGVTTTSSDIAIAIGPASFPRGLARSQIVTRAGPNRVEVNEYNIWSAPLEAEFLRVLGDNMATDLGTDHLVVYPREAAFSIDYTVLLDVIQFDGTLGEEVTLRVRWSISTPSGKAVDIGSFENRQALADGTGYDALVAAHSAALASLATELSTRLRTLHSGAPPP